jgi:Flp pilus assembly protein CpaB
MVMTRPPVEAPDAPAPASPAAPQRRVERPRRLPGGRAVVGGLLVALAGVGTLVAWQQASGTPDRSYAVAARAVQPGETLGEADVRLVPVELPDGVAGGAFTDPAAVAGRVALGPIAEGELVQAGTLSDVGSGVPTAEVSFALARDRVLDGRLGSGDLVDVFVTGDEGTSVVAERVQVVTVTDGGATLTSGAELTVTLALTEPAARGEVIQAVRSGEVTLVRSTHLGSAADGSGGASGSGAATTTTSSAPVPPPGAP